MRQGVLQRIDRRTNLPPSLPVRLHNDKLFRNTDAYLIAVVLGGGPGSDVAFSIAGYFIFVPF